MEEKYRHIMLDIETMGTDSNSCIASIGAIEFNIETGGIGREFHVKIDLQDCINKGFRISGSTIEWWMNQDDAARYDLFEDTVDLYVALKMFNDFINREIYYVWGNSARFDCGILSDAYSTMNIPIPWSFRNERDVRTLVSFAPNIKKDCIFDGIKHNAIDDCKHQIKYCSQIWNKLNK